MTKIGLFEALNTARALRRLKPDPVPDDLITQVLDAAIRPPSGGNAQNWIFIVVPTRRNANDSERSTGRPPMKWPRSTPPAAALIT